MIRKNIYKWHRISSLIIAIPVLLWAVSGLMHPMMTTIKPQVATQSLQTESIDSTALEIPLQEALRLNNIEEFHNVRLIHIDTNWFYQLQLKNAKPPIYISAKNGKELRNGDKLYAQYIAKLFLQGQPESVRSAQSLASPRVTSIGSPQANTVSPEATEYSSLAGTRATAPLASETASHDCCDEATSCVLADTSGSLVQSVEIVNNFDGEYKYVNRLLPVYKVQFDRADGIRVYVETTQDRFAFVMDNRRATFDTFFAWCHTWEWLSFSGKFKYLLMGLITSLAFLSTCMGLYIFFITKTKKGTQPMAKARRRHRIVSLVACVFTLMFTFSGGLHALEKLNTPDPIADNTSNEIRASSVSLDYSRLQAAIPSEAINDISIAKVHAALYWRVSSKSKKLFYINATDYTILPNGDEQHAVSLVSNFSGHAAGDITQKERITKFAGEYGFINKRLPVWKISYASKSNERYYVETSTGKCAAYITDKDLFEGYSFALLHKHHFMDWAGKSARDISTMIAAGLQVIMVLVGLFLFYRWIRR
ncbi:MAG: PepSY domain-containing protein [Pseudobacter sp.]|uniref:PepSY domain-containing protein n=1 Tax=Pseudobacter sp. TaxID=2045420 RepID=UPI003F7E3543